MGKSKKPSYFYDKSMYLDVFSIADRRHKVRTINLKWDCLCNPSNDNRLYAVKVIALVC